MPYARHQCDSCSPLVRAALAVAARWRMRRCRRRSVPRSSSTRSRRSPNGLRVILSEDHSTPIVHVSVWYHVGSKNERPGRTGFAHLFEHMMFKGSKNVEPESHTSIIASVGGRSNAYTTEDETVFWETLPAQYLPLALWLEADRMATLRDRRRRVPARARGGQGRAPDARREPAVRPALEIILRQRVHDASVQAPDDRQHGGSRGGVDRRRARVPRDVLRSRERDGRRSSATSTRRRRTQLVKQYFGRVPKAARPVPRDIPKEPAQTKERRAVDRGSVAAAGGRRRVPRHLRRASRIRIRCTSRRRSCPTARARGFRASWSTTSGSR